VSDRLLPFAAVALVLGLIPGPSSLFVIGRTVALGGRAGVATAAGDAAGAYLQVAAVALGIGAAVQRSLAVFVAVKLLGACYLIWLGVRAIRERQGQCHHHCGAAHAHPLRGVYLVAADNREDPMRTHTVIDSPIGALTLAATDGALRGAPFGPRPRATALRPRPHIRPARDVYQA
jgi:hypothetical protein